MLLKPFHGQRIALGGSLADPLHGLVLIHIDTLAARIHISQTELGQGVPLLGRPREPFQRLGVILFDPCALVISRAKITLTVIVSGFRRQTKPFECGLFIFGHALTFRGHDAEIRHGGSLSLSRCQTEKPQSLIIRAIHAAAPVIGYAQMGLRDGISLHSRHLVPTHAFRVVLRHHIAFAVHQSKCRLRRDVTAITSALQPHHPRLWIPDKSVFGQVKRAQIALRHDITLPCGLFQPCDRLGSVFENIPAPFKKKQAERDLCVQMSGFPCGT